MSTTTAPTSAPKTQPVKPAAKTAPAKQRGTRKGRKPAPKRATGKPKTKARKAANVTTTLAAMANAKAKPAAKISGGNIARVQAKLRGTKPTAYLGISGTMLAALAGGTKSKGDLKEPARVKLRDLGAALGTDTYYGRKLAGMLWAVEKGADKS